MNSSSSSFVREVVIGKRLKNGFHPCTIECHFGRCQKKEEENNFRFQDYPKEDHGCRLQAACSRRRRCVCQTGFRLHTSISIPSSRHTGWPLSLSIIKDIIAYIIAVGGDATNDDRPLSPPGIMNPIWCEWPNHRAGGSRRRISEIASCQEQKTRSHFFTYRIFHR